ncbi:tyrosine-type recombinase/integrase, partial [Staphylococcus aureus]|uniref:tyrosine-type recombinase/integrase n=1 Tax=Staphylococcus aureus TaxID=1280 RepID=UPI0012AF50A7
LKASKKRRVKEPMFTVLAYHKNGERLTGEAIRRLVDGLCKQAGITKKMSPHRVRHSAITTVLDQNNGNYRATQRFSRHAQVQTVLKYDDNRKNLQKQMTDKISDLM